MEIPAYFFPKSENWTVKYFNKLSAALDTAPSVYIFFPHLPKKYHFWLNAYLPNSLPPPPSFNTYSLTIFYVKQPKFDSGGKGKDIAFV